MIIRPSHLYISTPLLLTLGLGVGSNLAVTTAPAIAQTCTPLTVVGTSQTEVQKTVSPISFLVTSTNWNTDFVVPSGANFTSYVATITSQEGTTYDIDVNLKYNDDTIDQAYSVRETELTVGESRQIDVSPRVGEQPYQVNLRVGGIEAADNVYTASVVGCSE